MIDLRFRPLEKWARKPELENRRSPFKMSYTKTLDALEYELRKLRAIDIFIEAGFRLEDLRNDGWPRRGSRPRHAGAVLYFSSPDGAMEFPCGTYSTFEDNLHAIALTLENLRAIDRYGVTLGHQQYRGFLALPAPQQAWTVEQSADFIGKASGVSGTRIIQNFEEFRQAYRKAAAKLHPDSGAANEEFYKLAEAERVLKHHHQQT